MRGKKEKEKERQIGKTKGRNEERNQKNREGKKEKLLPNPSKELRYYKEDSYLVRDEIFNIQVFSLAT